MKKIFTEKILIYLLIAGVFYYIGRTISTQPIKELQFILQELNSKNIDNIYEYMDLEDCFVENNALNKTLNESYSLFSNFITDSLKCNSINDKIYFSAGKEICYLCFNKNLDLLMRLIPNYQDKVIILCSDTQYRNLSEVHQSSFTFKNNEYINEKICDTPFFTFIYNDKIVVANKVLKSNYYIFKATLKWITSSYYKGG